LNLMEDNTLIRERRMKIELAGWHRVDFACFDSGTTTCLQISRA